LAKQVTNTYIADLFSRSGGRDSGGCGRGFSAIGAGRGEPIGRLREPGRLFRWHRV